jgi:hypothetical protein
MVAVMPPIGMQLPATVVRNMIKNISDMSEILSCRRRKTACL